MKNKNRPIFIFIGIFLINITLFMEVSNARYSALEKTKPIKIGIFYMKTERIPANKKTVISSVMLGIDEINEEGGVLKRKIEPVIVELENDLSSAAEQVKRIITEEKVSVVFCSGNSSVCEIVKPIFEKYKSILFCSCKSEGFEKHPNIIFTGTMPNQQIIPVVKWCFENRKEKFFLIGSDTSYSKIFNLIIKNNINELKGEVVGEAYIPSGSGNFDEAMQKIIQTKPDVILNTILGESNVYFFINLRAKKIKPESVPVMSFNITEDEFKHLYAEEVYGNYLVKSYFQNIDSEENRKFIKKLNRKYGLSQITDDAVEAGYFGVYLWKQTVEDAETDNAEEVMRFIVGQNLNAPEGMVCVNVGNQHTWKTIRIGKIEKDKQFEIIWSSDSPLQP
ncbi:MAG: transporter substrate-binding protein [bacterium]